MTLITWISINQPVLADYLLKKTVGQTYTAEDQFDFSVILPNEQLEHFNILEAVLFLDSPLILNSSIRAFIFYTCRLLAHPLKSCSFICICIQLFLVLFSPFFALPNPLGSALAKVLAVLLAPVVLLTGRSFKKACRSRLEAFKETFVNSYNKDDISYPDFDPSYSQQQIETVSSATIKFKSCDFPYSVGVFLFIPCSIALDFVPVAAKYSYILAVLSCSLLLLKLCDLCRLLSGVGKFMESVVIFSSIFVFGIVLLTVALFVAIYFERSELGSISCFVIIAAFVGIISSAAMRTSSTEIEQENTRQLGFFALQMMYDSKRRAELRRSFADKRVACPKTISEQLKDSDLLQRAMEYELSDELNHEDNLC